MNCPNTWTTAYASYHADVMAGRLPPRYLVHTCDAGFADCAVGAVTALYLAATVGVHITLRHPARPIFPAELDGRAVALHCRVSGFGALFACVDGGSGIVIIRYPL